MNCDGCCVHHHHLSLPKINGPDGTCPARLHPLSQVPIKQCMSDNQGSPCLSRNLDFGGIAEQHVNHLQQWGMIECV